MGSAPRLAAPRQSPRRRGRSAGSRPRRARAERARTAARSPCRSPRPAGDEDGVRLSRAGAGSYSGAELGIVSQPSRVRGSRGRPRPSTRRARAGRAARSAPRRSAAPGGPSGRPRSAARRARAAGKRSAASRADERVDVVAGRLGHRAQNRNALLGSAAVRRLSPAEVGLLVTVADLGLQLHHDEVRPRPRLPAARLSA